MAISTKSGGALIRGASPSNNPGANMQIILLAGKVTSKGPFRAGDVVDLPDAEAREFVRRGWGKEATPEPDTAQMDAPQVENREDDVDAKTAKRGPGRPKKTDE